MALWVGVLTIISLGWIIIRLLFAEWINEIGNKIFVLGAGFESFLFIFDDDFIIGDFNNFFARNGELGVNEGLKDGALDNNLLNHEIVGGESVTGDFAEFRMFLGLNFEADETKIEFKDFANIDDIFGGGEFVSTINNHAKLRVLADGFNI